MRGSPLFIAFDSACSMHVSYPDWDDLFRVRKYNPFWQKRRALPLKKCKRKSMILQPKKLLIWSEQKL